jgi:hypothetical protein
MDVKETAIVLKSATSHLNDQFPFGEDGRKIHAEDIGELLYGLLRMNPCAFQAQWRSDPAAPKNRISQLLQPLPVFFQLRFPTLVCRFMVHDPFYHEFAVTCQLDGMTSGLHL